MFILWQAGRQALQEQSRAEHISYCSSHDVDGWMDGAVTSCPGPFPCTKTPLH